MPLPPTSESTRVPDRTAAGARGAWSWIDALAPWREIAVANAGAALKSTEIALRATRVLGAAAFAVVASTTDDTFAHVRSRMSCRSTDAFLDLERDYLLRSITQATWRASLMTGMLQQAGDDATSPVRRRLDCALRCLGDGQSQLA